MFAPFGTENVKINYTPEEEFRLKQLRLKQLMNLRAKGFFIENVS
jgi:hypothetical protein